VARGLDKKTAQHTSAVYADGQWFKAVNYYDKQRFGLPEGPYVAQDIGSAIISGDYSKATSIYLKSGNASLDFPNGVPNDPLAMIDNRKLQFFLSAYNSILWNQELSDKFGKDTIKFEIFKGHIVALPKSREFDNSIEKVFSRPELSLSQNVGIQSKTKERIVFTESRVFAGLLYDDVYHPGKYAIDLAFYLPSGCYATLFVRQLLEFTNSITGQYLQA